MSIYPESVAVKKAVKWISEQRQQNPQFSLRKLVLEAATRFNLNPREEEFLLRFFEEQFKK